MPYRRKKDSPGEWFHVCNRAVARRTMFEGAHDFAAFADALGATVADGLVEVSAFCCLHTHFHLLVRSVGGELDRAMQRAQLGFVRAFNRARRRDGPLLRGRFRARHVDSLAYRRLVVAYIDANPVTAGIVQRPWDYPAGSADAYVNGGGPAWLDRSWVEAEVRTAFAAERFEPSQYVQLFHTGFTRQQAQFVARQFRSGDRLVDVDRLLAGRSGAFAAWVEGRTRNADGTVGGGPVLPAEAVLRAAPSEPTLRTPCRAPLLRFAAGATFAQIGAHLHLSTEGARQLVGRATRAMASDATLAQAVDAAGRTALLRVYGARQTGNGPASCFSDRVR